MSQTDNNSSAETVQLINTVNDNNSTIELSSIGVLPEQVQEGNSTEVSNTVQEVNPIITILTNLLSNDEAMKNIGIVLNQQEIDVLKSIIKSNLSLITDIQACLSKILLDNNINLSDLPELLSIQKKYIDVINNIKNINKNNIPQIASDIIKFLIRALIKENILVISNSDEFLINFDKLIDSVTELITFFTVVPTPLCNINWSNLFSCKK
jgi:hypothetical protein